MPEPGSDGGVPAVIAKTRGISARPDDIFLPALLSGFFARGYRCGSARPGRHHRDRGKCGEACHRAATKPSSCAAWPITKARLSLCERSREFCTAGNHGNLGNRSARNRRRAEFLQLAQFVHALAVADKMFRCFRCFRRKAIDLSTEQPHSNILARTKIPPQHCSLSALAPIYRGELLIGRGPN
jgi:hypothetical protein